VDVVVEVIIVVTCAAETGSACVVGEEIVWLLKPITLYQSRVKVMVVVQKTINSRLF